MKTPMSQEDRDYYATQAIILLAMLTVPHPTCLVCDCLLITKAESCPNCWGTDECARCGTTVLLAHPCPRCLADTEERQIPAQYRPAIVPAYQIREHLHLVGAA
jgi:hypothetical protein